MTTQRVRRFDAVTPQVVSQIDALARQFSRRDDITDAGSGIWFQRQLEYIFPEVLRTMLPVLNAMRLFPLDTEVPAGALTFTHRMVEPLGLAQWISNPADDLPFADVAAVEKTFNTKPLGLAYQYSIYDILAGQMAGTSLDVERGIATRRGIEEMQNRVFWNGDDAVGIFGVLTYPYVPRHIFANPIAAGTAADTIIAELNAFVNGIVSLSKETERPTTLVLPTDEYSYIASTPRSATTDTTILNFFLANNPYIENVESAYELADAGPNGEQLAIAYSPEKRIGKLVLPLPYTQLPAQERNLSFVVNAHSKVGGFCSMYPLAMAIGEIPNA